MTLMDLLRRILGGHALTNGTAEAVHRCNAATADRSAAMLAIREKSGELRGVLTEIKRREAERDPKGIHRAGLGHVAE